MNVVKIINSRILFTVIVSLVFFMFDDWFIDIAAITVLFSIGVIGNFVYLVLSLYKVSLRYFKKIPNIQSYSEKFLSKAIGTILSFSISISVIFLYYYELNLISKQNEEISYILKYCIKEKCNDDKQINEGYLKFSNFKYDDLMNGKFVIKFSITYGFSTGLISCIFNSSSCIIKVDSTKGILLSISPCL